MELHQKHPVARFEGAMQGVQAKARLAIVALGLTGLNRVFTLVVSQWQNSLARAVLGGGPVSQEQLELSDSLMQIGAVAMLGLLVVTGVLFLRWIAGAVRLTRDFGALLGFTPSEAVWSFIIPIVSLFRPYRVARDLHDALDPDRVPPPPLVATADESTGYREVRFTEPPAPRRLPHAFIGAWWAFFVVSHVLGQIVSRMNGTSLADIIARNTMASVSDACDLVGVALAITVVGGLTGRLVERFRRLRHNPPEVLEREGIVLGAAL